MRIWARDFSWKEVMEDQFRIRRKFCHLLQSIVAMEVLHGQGSCEIVGAESEYADAFFGLGNGWLALPGLLNLPFASS